MKIKRLHIRNIASIETADIDFENGLVDRQTGKPASIFLISGDTGAGKSVILDAISMALYKTTPRLSGVSNPKNNSFKNSSDQEVSVGSLQQYTRIGISPNDDCYSELAFDGNDGNEYTVRISLGIMKSTAKDENGNYIWKPRTPQWNLKQGGDEWEKDADIKPRIANAIGLTFEQFNRMAMLAQGQFERFLCGEKKEREEVLEQLTNTEHFTKYGEAIKKIFDRAKEEKKTAEAYEKSVSNLIGTNQVDEWERVVNENNTKKEGLEKEIDETDDILKQIGIIEQNSCDQKKAEKELERLHEIAESSDFLKKKLVCELWDKSADARSARSRYNDNVNRAEKLDNEKKELQKQYENYVADLLWRKKQNDIFAEKLQQTADWIEQQNDKKTLYDNVQTIEANLKQYAELIDNIFKQEKQKNEESAKTQLLADGLAKAQKALAIAQNAVSDKQAEIGRVQSQRDALAVEKLQADIPAASNAIQQWETLGNDFSQIGQQKTELEALSKELDTKAEEWRKCNDEVKRCKDIAAAAEKKYNETVNRYSTMSCSANETLENLRKELHNVENCPLCGQKLDHAHFEKEFFSQMLTPLQQEREKAQKESQDANYQLLEITKKAEGIAAEGKLKREQLTQKQTEFQQFSKSVMQRAIDGGLDTSTDLPPQITKKQQDAEILLEKLQAQQKLATELQKRIDVLQNELSPLTDQLTNATKAERDAAGACEYNAQLLGTLEKNLAECDAKKRTQHDELTDILAETYPQWETQITETKENLKSAAENYAGIAKPYETGIQQLRQDASICDSAEHNSRSILELFKDWACAPEPKPFTTNDMQKAWNGLLQNVSANSANFKATMEALNKDVKILNEYSNQNISNVYDLDYLISQASHVEEIKNAVRQMDTDVAAQQQAIKTTAAHIKEALAVLHLSSPEELPDKTELEATKANLTSQRDGCLNAITEVKTLWEKYIQNQKELEKAQAAVQASTQKYNRWELLNRHFGGTRFRTLVQTYILRPLLNNANIYLEKITDRYALTCSEENEQLSILVLDKYNKNEVRSVTVLSGGERFMISLALSLALSSLNRPDLNTNILFIDEGFGTLDEKNLDSVMQTLETLQQIVGQQDRRVGMISHREEIVERVSTQIQVIRKGAGRSVVEVVAG